MQNRLKTQQILAAIGSRAEPGETDDIAHDMHDWHEVRYFDDLQRQAIEDLGCRVAPLFADALKRAFRDDFIVEWSQTQETVALQYKEEALEDSAFLAFQAQDNPAIRGSLALPRATAQDWVTRLLGESTEASETLTLSPLEITLLSDIAASLVNAFSSSYTVPLDALPPLSVSKMLTPLEDTDELCTMAFTVREEKAEEQATLTFSIVMPCSQLAQTLEGMAPSAPPSQGKLSEALREHVENISVQITAEFASTQLTLEQAMGLNVGDVLLMDKDLDAPMVLKIGDRLIFYGKPAQYEDHYAVVVTDHAES
ncbi:MAG: FliM/FliN family flagellar motor switch protein [Phycisphaeraceae bacterium]|nr:FliM/FliN family flagellar motor switch protein [Phycisphaeraceae bacterium]